MRTWLFVKTEQDPNFLTSRDVREKLKMPAYDVQGNPAADVIALYNTSEPEDSAKSGFTTLYSEVRTYPYVKDVTPFPVDVEVSRYKPPLEELVKDPLWPTSFITAKVKEGSEPGKIYEVRDGYLALKGITGVDIMFGEKSILATTAHNVDAHPELRSILDEAEKIDGAGDTATYEVLFTREIQDAATDKERLQFPGTTE